MLRVPRQSLRTGGPPAHLFKWHRATKELSETQSSLFLALAPRRNESIFQIAKLRQDGTVGRQFEDGIIQAPLILPAQDIVGVLDRADTIHVAIDVEAQAGLEG